MEQTITVNGLNIFVWRNSKTNKRPLLLLHGYAGDHQGLLDLAQAFPDFDVIIPDLPGFGRSEPLKEGHSLENYVHFVKKLCDQLEISRGAIVGHSLGGSIALSFVEIYPEIFQKASLICPILSSGHWMAQAAKLYYKMAELLPRDMKKIMVDNKFLVYLTDSIVMTVRDKKKRKEILEQNYINYKQADGNALSQAFFTFFEGDVVKNPGTIISKIQIIAGDRDFIAAMEPLESLHDKMPTSEFTVIPGGGHLVVRETPEKVVDKLKGFLESSFC